MNPPISQVYLMDCMDLMKTLPDKSIDLAIVDPPYGIGINTMSFVKSGAVKTGKAVRTDFSQCDTEWDSAIPDKAYFDELFRVSRHQIIWGGNYFLEYLGPTPCFIVWDKDNGTTDFADCELAWASFDSPVRKFRYRWNGMLQENMRNKEERIHPNQKPVRLYLWLLEQYAKPGYKILDTHLGSGSSRIAAYMKGVDFIASEAGVSYFESQEKRFQEAIREPLFDQTPVKLEQGSMFG